MSDSKAAYADLDDERDRTVFIEYFPPRFKVACITAVWRNDGTLDYFVAA